MVEEEYLQAALPLFAAGEVEVLEWSFDTGWGEVPIPAWASELLDFYAEQNQLLGHGVTFSALSGQWTPRQEQWLASLREECARRRYRHISEHFGFMTAGSFHQSAPLPVPRTPETLRLGQERLRLLSDITRVPVGLENLALAFGPRDVQEQGTFLDELLHPIGGFLLLDLHNLYCQMCNFSLSADEILNLYPLERVQEMHISGGSWSESEAPSLTGPIRRDTHDEAVPDAVFTLLTTALRRCPNVEAVILERLGDTLQKPRDGEALRDDFMRLKSIIKNTRLQEIVSGASHAIRE